MCKMEEDALMRLPPVLQQLKECSRSRDISRGRVLHLLASQRGDDADPYVASALINMYSKCGSMPAARIVFDRLPIRDAVCWNSILFGYADNGQSHACLDLFERMRSGSSRCAPNALSIVAALKACASVANSDRGRDAGAILHTLAASSGLDRNVWVANAIVDMHGKSGRLQQAQRAFDAMQCRGAVAWNSLLFGYASNGEGERVLELIRTMQRQGCAPDDVTFVAALKACIHLRALELGRSVHFQASQHGCCWPLKVQNTLVDMYAKCRSMDEARRLFDAMPGHDVVSWNSLMMGYVENGQPCKALDAYLCADFRPDSVTILAALKACADLAPREQQYQRHHNQRRQQQQQQIQQKQQHQIQQNQQHQIQQECYDVLRIASDIHERATLLSFSSDMLVASTLVDVYAKLGCLDRALEVFEGMKDRDAVAWNALIFGYADAGEGDKALQLMSRMRSSCEPNALSYVGALKACCATGALQAGRELHAELKSRGLESDATVGNTLVDFYGKCGSMDEAQRVFDSLPHSKKCIVCWNALMTGYSRHGNAAKVLQLFERMQAEQRLQPNEVSFLCVLTTCNHAGMVEEGLHCFYTMLKLASSSVSVVKPGLEHYTCIVDILGRANRLQEAVALLMSGIPFAGDEAAAWNAVLWSAWKWRNAEVGRLAFQRMEELGNKMPGSYVVMSNLCRAAERL